MRAFSAAAMASWPMAAIDPSGNIWITGETDSDDFPLVHPLFALKAPYRSTGFVAKLDSSLNIVFSTFLGGTAPASITPALSTPASIAVDSAGNAYVAGSTGEAGFPATGPVFGTGTAGPNNNSINPLVYACQGKVEMSPSWQSRNVPFCPVAGRARVILRLPVKRRRALLASNPIEE